MHPIVVLIQSIYEKDGEERFRALYASRYDSDRAYWIPKLQAHFPDCLIENITDLNYAKCFSYKINLSGTSLGWFQQDEYLKDHQFHYWLLVHLSILEPYAVVKFERDLLIDEKFAVEFQDSPYLTEHAVYEAAISNFLESNGFQRLDDATLSLPVPGVVLELQEDTPSVYNCLFEDLYSFFPY